MERPDRLPRKLAAILYADVAGYSRLTGKDEDTTHRRLSEYLDLIANQVTRYGGHVMHYAGDAVLAMFDAVGDALLCAAQIQCSLEMHNANLPDERKVQFRVGVNLGDVIEDRGDIYGDGVNVAARLESLAEPGGICVSGTVYDAVGTRLPLDYESMGEQQVKNIEQPVRAYHVRLKAGAQLPKPAGVAKPKKASRTPLAIAVTATLLVVAGGLLAWLQPWQPRVEAASVERMAFPLPAGPSIAVLPFDNMSGDSEQDYLADGFTESLIARLAQVPELFVIARNSSFTYKGKPVKVNQVAEELGVRYVLEGSIQRQGDTLRIIAQLIDAVGGHHLWADSYDRDANALFAVQDEITRKVISGMGVALGGGEDFREYSEGTDSFEAFLHVLKGNAHHHVFRERENVLARQEFEKALAIDPDYGDALRQLGYTHWADARYRWSESREESIQLAKEYASRAEQAGATAFGLRSTLHLLEGEVDEALALRQRDLEISPNSASGNALMGLVLMYAGKPEQSIAYYQRGIRLSPLYQIWYPGSLGEAYRLLGRYEDAIASLNSYIEREPEDVNVARVRLAATLVQAGREDEAYAVAKEMLRLKPDFSVASYMRSRLYTNPQVKEQLQAALLAAGLPERTRLVLPDKPSIAVLPFTNMSDNPKQEYFVDGMTEDLITDLSKISGLFVIARNSSFTYKGTAVDVKQVSRELGVKYVLEGSVRRAADQVRINAQLIDATTGGHLWAERYDGSLDDVFALQDQVTQKIVAALAISLAADEQALHDTDNAQAHDAYLQGWAYYRLQTPEDFARAIPYFEEAISLDPNYAQAHAALASLYWDALENDWAFELNMPSSRAESRANEHLEEALKMPTPLAYILQSRMFSSLGFPNEALEEAEKAVGLDPNDATTLAGFANRLVLAGRPDEGLTFIQDAMRLDPHHPPSYLITQGAAEFGMERFKEAATTFARAVKRNADNELPLIYLAASYGHLGRVKDADDIVETANQLRARQGKGELNLEKRLSRHFGEIDFSRFGVKSAQERIRAGLIEIPALTWQSLVRPPLVPGSTWRVEGATEIDVATAKSLYDKGVVFIDTSTEDVWKEGHIPGAFNLRSDRDNEDPSRERFKEAMLKEIVDKTEEVVLYKCPQLTRCWNPAPNVAKAVTWGYQKVFTFSGGTKAWKEAGHPVEKDD